MHTVDLSAFYGHINEALLTLLSGLALWLAAYAKQWLSAHAKLLGEQVDAQLADGLNRALQNGVNIAMQQVTDLEARNPGVPVKGLVTSWAAQYAADHSPAAMEKFGLSPNDLALKALAYLPPVQQPIAVVEKVMPVEVKPLAPV